MKNFINNSKLKTKFKNKIVNKIVNLETIVSIYRRHKCTTTNIITFELGAPYHIISQSTPHTHTLEHPHSHCVG